MVRAVGVKKEDGSSLGVQSVGRPTEIARYSTSPPSTLTSTASQVLMAILNALNPPYTVAYGTTESAIAPMFYDQSRGRRVLVNCQGNLALRLIANSTSSDVLFSRD